MASTKTSSRLCPICGGSMDGMKGTARFCSTSCKDDYNNYRKTVAAAVLDAALVWRRSRGSVKGSFQRFTRALDRIAAIDAEIGVKMSDYDPLKVSTVFDCEMVEKVKDKRAARKAQKNAAPAEAKAA